MNRDKIIVEIVKGQSYPGILKDIVIEYDYIKKVNTIKFKYDVYLNPTKIIQVENVFNLWDKNSFREMSVSRIQSELSKYGVNLHYNECENLNTVVNASKWLVGTKVEIQQYKYNGIKYKVTKTGRMDSSRIDVLWRCMLGNKLNEFQDIIEQDNIIKQDFNLSFS